jgi:hypothetical protein
LLRDSMMTTGENSLSSHLRWELVQVMWVRPKDLSAVEIAALLVILTPADSRVIGGPAGRPKVRVLGVRGEHPASNLATANRSSIAPEGMK